MNIILKQSIAFILYIFFQVYLFNVLTLFNVATPFVYVLFLLLLPFSLPRPWLYIIAFIMGLLIDTLSDNYPNGLHAFACPLMVSLRPYMLQVTSSNYRSRGELVLSNQGFVWYAAYLLPLIFVHHLAFYFLEAFSFQHFFHTLWKAISSTIYTFLLSYMLSMIIYRR